MMSPEHCKPFDELFVFEGSAENPLKRPRVFNASALRKWALRHPHFTKTLRLALWKELIDSFEEERGIEPARLARMTLEYSSQPMLLVNWGDGSSLTVDGHHRAVWRFKRGIKWANAIEVAGIHLDQFELDMAQFKRGNLLPSK